MKSLLKISKYLSITLAVIFTFLLILSLIFQNRITQLFTNEINKHLETNIKVEKVKFSLIRDFPKASIEFKNIHIESPKAGDQWLDSIIQRNKFLEAEKVFVSFNVRNIINKEYSIDKITLKNSNLFLYNDSEGNSISQILIKESRSDTSSISIDLKNLRLENTGFKYVNSKSEFILDCIVNEAIGRISIDEGNTNIELATVFSLSTLRSKNRKILNPVPKGNIEGNLIISADSIYFNQLLLSIDKQSIVLSGSIFQKERRLKFDVATKDTDLDILLDNIALRKEFISGAIIEKMDAGFSLNFDKPTNSFQASIPSFRLGYAGASYDGSLYLHNLSSPYVKLALNGDLPLESLHRLYQFPEIESISGFAHINIGLAGSPGNLKSLNIRNILDLDRSINLHLNDVEIKLNKYKYPFQNISGNIMIAEHAWGDELSFNLAEQNIVINCMIEKLNNLFAKDASKINLTAGIWADKIDMNILLPEPLEGDTTGRSRNIDILDRINAKLVLNFDSLIINNFYSSQFDGALSYSPGFLNINSFNMIALEGSIAGNAAMIKKSGATYLARGWFDLEGVNINKTFRVFNNFGQNQIVANNINGALSGSLSINTECDSSFKLIPSTLSVTGNYSIYKGELVNFEPILKLSRFIEVSELENIRFEDLHNDLIIADEKLLIPSMEINSSAFNISLSGEQEFSGDYEYHLSILLSEILSNKAKSSGSYISEFGEVEDDGLGRTTLFLKMEKLDNETNVSYDIKRLSEEIKVSLQEEKQNLKTILNEEYGWYKSDSVINSSNNNTKRFRITWEEADSITPLRPAVKKKRKGLFKNVFKPDTTIHQFNNLSPQQN